MGRREPKLCNYQKFIMASQTKRRGKTRKNRKYPEKQEKRRKRTGKKQKKSDV